MTDCDNMKGFDTESIIFISTKTSYKIHHKHIVLTLTILTNYLNYSTSAFPQRKHIWLGEFFHSDEKSTVDESLVCQVLLA